MGDVRQLWPGVHADIGTTTDRPDRRSPLTRVPLTAPTARYFHPTDVEVINRLRRLIELHSPEVGEHNRRVAQISYLIALQFDLLPEQVLVIRDVAPLHDVGKILTPEPILNKRGVLTPQEQDIMRRHALLGAEILAGGTSLLLQTAETVARHHHERWDGWGYPSGLRGEEIPLSARIVAVADALDAMTHDRAYRPALPGFAAEECLQVEAGRQFDPGVVEALWTAMASRHHDNIEAFLIAL